MLKDEMSAEDFPTCDCQSAEGDTLCLFCWYPVLCGLRRMSREHAVVPQLIIS